jgi:carbon monoxide dehydrogenase subunit G
MQTLQEEFAVDAPIEGVYRAISDVGAIGTVVAGVKAVEVLGPLEAAWTVEVRAGMIAQRLRLEGRIVEQQPPHFMGFAAAGRNVSVTGAVTLAPAEAGGGTLCRVAVQAEVTGRLAPLVELVSRTTQKQLIAETIANFRRRLAETR